MYTKYKISKHFTLSLQGEDGGTGQLPVCPQEVASEEDESSSDPGADQEGAAAGGVPGRLHGPGGPTNSSGHLPVGLYHMLTPGMSKG